MTALILAVAGITIGLGSGIALGVYPTWSKTEENSNNTSSEKGSEVDKKGVANLPNAYPFKSKRGPSSPYGFRIDPFTHQYKHHAGIDYSLPAGTPVLAAGNGNIKTVGYDSYSGQYVIIEHGNGYTSKYAHLRSAYVVTGNKVLQGEQIGEVGSTGKSTGAHLHFEVSQNNNPINPLMVLNQEYQPITSSRSSNQFTNQASLQNTSTTLQRVPFITNSGVTYRMVEIVQIK